MQLRKLIALLLFICPTLFAQSTTVSGTVTDADSQAWLNGSYQFQFVPLVNYNGPYSWTGGTFNPVTTINGLLNSSGAYSVSVPSNSAITPTGSSWQLTVCPQGSGACFSTQVVITGATQTANANPPGIRVPPGANTTVYSTNEVANAQLGNQAYLIGTGLQVCTVVTSGSCTTWASAATGGSGTGTVTHTVGALTLGQLIVGNGAADIKTGDLSGDISTAGATATTLATVNSNVGSFTSANITVNGKGLVTAAANGTGGGGLSGMTAGQIPVAATATTVTSSVATTGTGNVVLATSPTLVTPNLGTPSTIVLTNATGAPTWNQSTTGNAATSTALASSPTQCTTGQFATGIATSGNANCATPSGSGTVTHTTGALTAGFATLGNGSADIKSDANLDDSITTANTLTYAGTGGISSVGYVATGSGAGFDAFGQGADNCVAKQPANSMCIESPASIGTSYHRLWAATPSTGIPHFSYSAPTITETISLVNLASDVTGQLPIGAVGSAGLSGTSPVAISSAGAISVSAIPLTSLATQAADTVTMNATGSSASPTAVVMPTCATSGHADVYDPSTHAWTCNSISSGSGLSGMTAGQVPIAATATTVTSSQAIQGTDTSLLSSGTVSGTGVALCTDANGGATTSGCATASNKMWLMQSTSVAPVNNDFLPINSTAVGQASVEKNAQMLVPFAVTATAIFVTLTANTGASNTVSYTLQTCAPTSGACTSSPTALTCTVAAASNTCSSTGQSVAIPAGDLADIKIGLTGTAVTAFQQISIIYQ